MNYIAEINAFEQWLETHYLPISSQLLWYKLMAICNRSGWSEWVTVDNLRLMAAMQMGREATLIKARDELIKAGLIEYQKGKKGSPNKYKIISFTCKSVVESEVKGVVQSVVESEVKGVVQSVDIYKHKQNKTKHIPSVSPTDVFFSSPELDKTFRDYIDFRKGIKKPMTDRAIQLAVSKLEKLASSSGEFKEDEAIEILNNSIMNGWQGLFALKKVPEKKAGSTNRFNNFHQRDYDYDALQKQLLEAEK